MNRMKTYENRAVFHTFDIDEFKRYESAKVDTAKIHTGVCGVLRESVYVTQVAAQNNSSARPGARAAGFGLGGEI